MKVKITEPGWAGFTGQFGQYEFVDGVSVDDIGRADAAYLSGLISIEDAASGKNPSISQRIIDTYMLPASGPQTPVAPTQAASTATYTKESLEAIADTSGIKGIREVADPLGIKGNSIAELIGKVLSAQPAAPEVAPVVADSAPEAAPAQEAAPAAQGE